ncbi:hypothetical protein A1O3_10094 [Capronia epimyces CBS 606.96]|uniref:Cytochrome P450 oxidoreductase n=1 Tax=Capronia epimyces CBS 606.96 TaxID=1182542 RepID=W9X8Z9_9EURO|nr:uncharacterized protein A1O3_10094 [Capronia epimyces CBS 606.96]EXJ76937.1 hypothetical protein A1O3_10094 [Capronia epimyces CBS 606.96]
MAVAILSLIGLAALVLYTVLTCYQNYRKCPQFDGPFLAKISGAWLFFHTFSGKLNEDNAALLRNHGSFVRISPDKVVTNDPVVLRHMSSPRSDFRRGTFYDAFSTQPTLRNVLSQKDEKLHNSLRSKLIRGYSGKDLPNLEADIDARIADLVALIGSECSNNKLIDFSSFAQYFTLDVLTHISFSAPVGYLTQNRDVYSYISKVSDFLQVLELGANIPTVQRILDSVLMAPFRPKITDADGMGAMMGMASKAVAFHYAPDAKAYPDMLGSFIKHGLTQQEAESEAMVQVLGGSDSTATAVRMIMLYIITHPEVYGKCVKEIEANESVFGDSISSAASRQHLPYVQACIKEGLRIWPPLQALNSKLSPPGGETVNGVFIPGGIEVCHNAYTTQRRTEIYGVDADQFRPERWLEAAEEAGKAHAASIDQGLGEDGVSVGAGGDGKTRLARMESTLELIFGSGRFGCLGRHIALIELDKVIPVLLRDFGWAVADPSRGIESKCFGVFVQKGMWLKATPRRVHDKHSE